MAILPLPGFSAIIYVDQNATGSDNGTSWSDAYVSLSGALSSASPGDEIWVSQGVYKPEALLDLNASGGSDPREAVFNIPDGVALYGGFTGSEITRAERDWGLNPVILSGDLDNNDIDLDANQIAEDADDIAGNNAYHVIYTENAGAATRLDGFVVTAGSASIAIPVNVNDPNLDGGGWYNMLSSPGYASSPTIANCEFHGNYAVSEGGGIYNTPGPAGGEITSLIENCLFSRNKADVTAGAIYIGSFSPGNYQPHIFKCEFIWNEAYRRGGALYLLGDHAMIDSSVFTNNRVTAISPDMSTLPGSGGGASLVTSNATFTACYFTSNDATGNPTGAYEGGGGGAIYASTNEPQSGSLGFSEPRFISCGFYENVASGNGAAWGGAIVNLSDGGVLRPLYVNCVFTGNQAQNHGGAVANFTRVIGGPDGFTPALEPVFTNCTFTENHAGQRGGAIYNDGYLYMGAEVLQAEIQNSILWHNTADIDGPQIYNDANNTIDHSLIEGSGGSGGGWDTSLGSDGGNNIDTNPGFVNGLDPLGPDNIPATNDDGFRLAITSAAVDAGNGLASGLAGIPHDYIGNSRNLGSNVDMGAYERAGIIIPDLDIYWLDEWPPEPPCLYCPPFPWSIVLYNPYVRTPQFVWRDRGQITLHDDYALITGEIYNVSDKGMAFKVYMKLDNPRTWRQWNNAGGTYFALTREAKKTAYTEHYNWTYWQLSKESYIEGIGDVNGKIYLQPFALLQKTGFQMGKGANAWDSDNGLGGNFCYKGKALYNGKPIYLYGLGSINVDATICKENCVPVEREIIFETDLITRNRELGTESDPDGISIYPIPARDYLTIDFNEYYGGHATMQIVDMAGREKLNNNINLLQGSKQISLEGLEPGMYILKVVTENKTVLKGFVVE